MLGKPCFLIEYRYADNQMDRLRPLAADLIARKVAVIAAVAGNNSALVAKALTSTIPILFTSGIDPVKAGLVAGINRPEANVTGVSWFHAELGNKLIEVLHELVPQAELIALLLNPNNPEGAFFEQSAQEGARVLGRRLLVLKAGTAREIDEAFATFAERRVNAVLIGSDPFYATRARQLAVLAARHTLPMIASAREYPMAGGLISYGNSVTDAYRRVGILLAASSRVPSQPTCRSTAPLSSSLSSTVATAKALGLEVPPTLLARADEVIE